MKRFVCIFAVLLMLLTCLPVMANDNIIFNETFNGYATNMVLSLDVADGAYGTRVIESGSLNKSLLLRANDSAVATYSAKVAASGLIILEADFEPVSNLEFASLLRLKDSTGKLCELIKYSAYDGFTLGDGKSIRPQATNRVYKFKVKVDTQKKKYSVYVNNTELVKEWPLENSSIGAISASDFEFSAVSGAVCEVKLDNIRVYSGTEFKNSFPSVAYSNEVREFDDTVTEEAEEATEVYYRQDFDRLKGIAGSGLMVADKGNVLELRTADDSGNNYVYIEKSIEDPYIDIPISVDTKRYVLSADITAFDNLGSRAVFTLKDSANVFCTMLTLSASGDVVFSDGTVLGRVKNGEFSNVAVAINASRKTVDLYFNNNLVSAGRAMDNKAFGDIAYLRFQISGSTAPGTTLGIDDIRVYSGNSVKELDNMENVDMVAAKSVYPDDSAGLKQLDGTVSFMLFNGAVFANGKKFFPDNKPIVEDGVTLLPVRLVSEAFGLSVDWIESEQKVKIGDKAEFVIGDPSIKIDGSTVTSNVPPKIINSNTYLPLRIIGENILKKTVNWDERGFIVISDSVFNPRNEKTAIEEAYNYMLYSRPKAAEILEIYNNSAAKGQHPKIYAFEEDFVKIREDIKSDPVKKEWADYVIRRADATLNAIKLEYALPDGLRMAPGYTLHDRIFDLSTAYQLTLDKKYVDRVYFELQSGAEFPDWNPKHFLDTSDVISAYGLAYDWCYDAFTPEQRAFIRETLMEKGLEVAYNSIYGIDQVYWTRHRHNWNAVCNGGIGLAAMAMMDDEPEFAADLIEKTLRGMEYMLDGFDPDGGWREGTSYWSYTNEFYAPYMALLTKALGTTFDYTNIPGVQNTSYYYLAMEGPTGTFNYSNNGGGTPNAPSLFWYADAFNNPDIGKLRSFLMSTKGLQGEMYDILWYKDEYHADTVDLPLDMSFREIETGSMRSSWTDKGANFIAYRGGKNNVEHTHYDKGGFVFDSSGIRWAIDLGGDNYNMPDYFGIDTNYYRIRTEGHNTYVINPDFYRGQEHVANCPIIREESKPKGGIVVLDLHEAYVRDTSSAIRGYKFDERRNTLTIRDEIDKNDDGDLYWFMHTRADVEIKGNNAVLTQGGKVMNFSFISNDPSATLSVMDAVPLPTSPVYAEQNANQGVKKLVIKSNRKGNLTITAKLTPDVPGIDFKPVSNEPIANWTIEDGDVNPAPKVSMIRVDGEEIKGFDANNMDYTVIIEDMNNLPSITAETDHPYEVIKGNANIVPTSIIVSDATDNFNKTVYRINFKLPVSLTIPAGMSEVPPKEIKASENPQPENNDKNVYDNDYETRWSAEGDVWIQFDLGEVINVGAVGLSFYLGNERVSYFDVQVSKDGVEFTNNGAYETSGETSDMEIFSVQPVEARYVRILCHGNSLHKWNSVTEYRVFGR